MLQLKDLKVGDKVLMPYYDDQPFTVESLDENDEEQPVRVFWDNGSWAWPEQRYVCGNTVKL